MDRLKPIDIPKLRAEMLKTISIYRRRQTLANLIKSFFGQLAQDAKVDRRTAVKLHDYLIEMAPELRVFRVDYEKKDRGGDLGPRYEFKVHMYDMDLCDKADFNLQSSVTSSGWDMDWLLSGDQFWEKHADFIESRLKGMPYAAQRFNAGLEELRKYARLMSMPPDGTTPVYPMSDAFNFYGLDA